MMKSAVSLFFLFSFNCLAEVSGYSIGKFQVRSPIHKSNPHSIGRFSLENINRLNYRAEMGAHNQFEMGAEVNQIFERSLDPLQKLSFEENKNNYRVYNIKPELVQSKESNNSYYIVKELDRLRLTREFSTYDLTLGRQAISFGSAKLVNPTDIFAPFNLLAIDKEERQGVDALRLRKSLGVNSELDFGIILGHQALIKNSAAYLRGIFSTSQIEIKPLFTYYKKAKGIGLDLLGELKGANIYLESMWTSPDLDASSDYFHATVGGEYIWTADLMTIFEFHYNGAGEKEKALYDLSGESFAISKGGSYLLARNYFMLLLSYQLHALHTLNLSGYQNIDDGSQFLNGVWSWSLSDETKLETGLQLGLGQESDEFALYGKSLYSKFSFYF